MKKLLTLLFTVITMVCFAQVNVQISMPNPVDASIANWTNGFVVTATSQKTYERCCLILTIKGPVNCGSLTPQTASTFTFEANKPKVFNGQNAIALFGTNCVLTPGSYTLYATVYINGTPQAPPATRQFEIKKEEPAAQVNLSINMPNPVDASTSNWTNGFVVTATTQKSVERCCVILTIKGPVNCGTLSPPTAPSFLLRANEPKVFSGQNAIALFGTNCILTPGSYTLYATVYINGKPQAPPASRPFEIRKEEPSNYQPPRAIAPTDGTVISEADAKKPVTFRWTPVTPTPKPGTFKYILRVYEVKTGQTATAIIKSAAPVFQKEVTNQNQFVLPSLNQLTVAKGSSLAWTVQAVDLKGTPMGGNNGTSGVMVLKTENSNCTHSVKIESISCLGNVNGIPKYRVCIVYKNTATSPCDNCSILLNDPLNNSGIIITNNSQPGVVISNINSGIPNILNPQQQTQICFDASVQTGYNLKFKVFGTCTDDANNSENSLFDTIPPPCICNDCDSVNIEYVDTSYTKVNNNTYNLTGTLDVNIPIYGVEFQVVSWEYTATPASCTNGVNSLEQSAMLLLPSTTVNGNVPVACDVSIPGNNANAVKCVRYLTATPITDPLFNLTVGLPGALPGLPINCCFIKYKVCIKATVFLDAEHCNYCSYIDCFEFDNH